MQSVGLVLSDWFNHHEVLEIFIIFFPKERLWKKCPLPNNNNNNNNNNNK